MPQMSLPVRAHFTCLTGGEKQYLQVGVVDRERWAEESLDNGHHCLCHILLQGQICMVTVCGWVAHLKYKNNRVHFWTSSSSHHASTLFSAHAVSEWIEKMSTPKCIHDTNNASLERFHSDRALHWTCPPGSCQRASRYGWRCRSPSFPPRCPRSSDSQSSHKQFWPEGIQTIRCLISFR